MSKEYEITSWVDIWTEEEMRILKEAQGELDALQRKNGIREALKQWCERTIVCRLNMLERVFYTLKAVICILLKRKGVLCSESYVDAVATWTSYGSYNESREQLNVGYGIFNNWHYDICSSLSD